jgi:threonine/homoserine/homoserine lactone efflux protein
MVFTALIRQLTDHRQPVATQAAILSGFFMALCGMVYTGLSLLIGATAGNGKFSDRRRRIVEAVSGCLVAFAALKLI